MIVHAHVLGLSTVLVLLIPLLHAPAARAQSDAEKEARASAEEDELFEALAKAAALEKQEKIGDALPYHEKASALALKVLGPDHSDTGVVFFNLGNAYRVTGHYDKAEPCYRRSLAIYQKHLGKNHAHVADVLVNLAVVYQQQGKPDRAEPLYCQGLEIHESALGKDHLYVGMDCYNLGTLYWGAGRTLEAEPFFHRSLKIMEAQLGKDHASVADVLNNLGNLYRSMGRFVQAESIHRRSLEIREARLGKDHLMVAQSVNNLGDVYSAMGQNAKAEPLFTRSLEIREARLGKDHPEVAASLNNLAEVYRLTGRAALAEPLYRRSLEIREKHLGKDHADVAQSLNNLALLYKSLGQLAKAEPIYRRSLEIVETKLGKDHPDLAAPLNNLATVYLALGQYAKAEPLYRRSLEIRETQLGPDHPAVISSLHNLALFRAAEGNWAAAAQLFDRERRGARRYVADILPGLSNDEQLAFLATQDEVNFHTALLAGWERREDAGLCNRSAGWLLNGKAVAHEAFIQRALLERDATTPKLRTLVDELNAVRRQRAALTLASPKPGEQAHRLETLQDLETRQQQIEARLREVQGQSARVDPWVELAALRKSLPKDALFIDIARFRLMDGQSERERKPARYAAWLIPPAGQGEVRIIDLGEAGRIEDAIKAMRLELQKTQSRDPKKNPILLNGEEEAEEALRQLMIPLAKLVLEPLLEHIGTKKQWIISPDAALWLVPWAALPLKNVKYAVEKYQISYVISGRDLVTPAAKVKPGQAIVMADPDYDLGLAEARAAVRKLLNRPESIAELRGITSSSALSLVERLKGTAGEAAAIEPKLARYAGAGPKLYLDRDAQEAVFKSLKSPKVLVLATHGFFLEDQQLADLNLPSGRREPAEGPSKSALLTKDGKLFENPLVRCGLLLAGCNDRESARTETDEDGVLTGLEIVGTDLRGTELVVLSACETGLGQVRNGEGVAGLRQAFQLAGARAVVATLWQVPDRDSARLMGEFFDNLAAGKSKAEALREAQLARIKARRTRDGAAHPFFWAAFTLTGE